MPNGAEPLPVSVRTTRPAPKPAGTTEVQRVYPRGHQAVCSCGQLSARRRRLHGWALVDALIHAAQTDCRPAQPISAPRITAV
uniref:Uncharacterized protein n=1 Tax=Mycolicibacterium sp. CBMA 213 TaxID=1968788 RepID=A0A1S6GKT4_9MYCO|nr:hypothetical protein pCBMA213_2_00046 [Mycolicibacterium sp. CBMA 213]